MLINFFYLTEDLALFINCDCVPTVIDAIPQAFVFQYLFGVGPLGYKWQAVCYETQEGGAYGLVCLRGQLAR